MIQVTCIGKNYDIKGNTLSYVIEDGKRQQKAITKQQLKGEMNKRLINVTNLKLTLDNRLIEVKANDIEGQHTCESYIQSNLNKAKQSYDTNDFEKATAQYYNLFGALLMAIDHKNGMGSKHNTGISVEDFSKKLGASTNSPAKRVLQNTIKKCTKALNGEYNKLRAANTVKKAFESVYHFCKTLGLDFYR